MLKTYTKDGITFTDSLGVVSLSSLANVQQLIQYQTAVVKTGQRLLEKLTADVKAIVAI